MSELLPCAHCGAPAESDWRQGYMGMDGRLGNAAAIYCVRCGVQISFCYRDDPSQSEEQVQQWVTSVWNRRTPPIVGEDARDNRDLIHQLNGIAERKVCGSEWKNEILPVIEHAIAALAADSSQDKETK